MVGRIPPRIFRRVSFEAEIRIRFEESGEEMVARTANISLGGMFVISPDPRSVGSALELEFKLPEQPAPVRGRGRVVWVREEAVDAAPPGMGVRFLELTPGSRELIFQVVERRVRDGGSPYDEGSEESGSIADRRDEEADLDETVPGSDATGPGGGETGRPGSAPSIPADPPPARPGDAGSEDTAVDIPSSPPPPAEAAPSPPSSPFASAPWAGEPPAEPGAAAEAEAGERVLLPVPESFDDDPPPPPEASHGPSSEPSSDLSSSRPGVRLVEMPDPEPPPAAADTEPAGRSAPPPPRGAGYARARPRRPMLWIALTAILLVAAGAWYWISRSGDPGVEAIDLGPVADAGAPSGTAAAGEAAETEADADPDPTPDSASASAPASTPADSPAPAAGADQLAAEPPAPASAAAAQRVSRITWEEYAGGTELVIWGDGGFDADSYRSYRLDGASPREVVRLLGIGAPLEPAVVEVGTAQVRRIRSGLHLETDPDELHVVIDLAGPGVGEATIRPEGTRLRLRLEGR